MTVPRWAPPALWAALVLAVNSIPGSELPDVVSRVDELAHFLAYAALGLLTARALRPTRGPAAALLLTAALVPAFGAFDELHQALIPGRHPDLLDCFADAVGGLVGAIAASLVDLRRQPT